MGKTRISRLHFYFPGPTRRIEEIIGLGCVNEGISVRGMHVTIYLPMHGTQSDRVREKRVETDMPSRSTSGSFRQPCLTTDGVRGEIVPDDICLVTNSVTKTTVASP